MEIHRRRRKGWEIERSVVSVGESVLLVGYRITYPSTPIKRNGLELIS